MITDLRVVYNHAVSYGFLSAWFGKGSLLFIQNSGGGYNMYLIASTDPDYFSALCISYYNHNWTDSRENIFLINHATGSATPWTYGTLTLNMVNF